MLNLNSIMLGTSDLPKMKTFYEAVFEKKPDMEEGGYSGWLVGQCFFTVGEHSEVHGNSKEPQRIMFNIETKEVKEEFDRISKTDGVTVIKEPYQMS